jgi:hypothetical protein
LIKQIPLDEWRDSEEDCLRETTGCSSPDVKLKHPFVILLHLEGKTTIEVGSLTTTELDSPHV